MGGGDFLSRSKFEPSNDKDNFKVEIFSDLLSDYYVIPKGIHMPSFERYLQKNSLNNERVSYLLNRENSN